MCASLCDFRATCLRLNILGVPDCPCLGGMYSELKGFVVGRAISRAGERKFWYSGDKKMRLKWLHSKRKDGSEKCDWRVSGDQPHSSDQGFATCCGSECAWFYTLEQVVASLSSSFHSSSAKTNESPIDFHTLASIGWDFNSTKFPVESEALLFGLLKWSLDNFDQEEGCACSLLNLLCHVTAFQDQHLICFANNELSSFESKEQMGRLLGCTSHLSLSQCLLSLRRCRCCSYCRKN